MRGFSALSVLVVDDHRHMRALVNSLLRGFGFTNIREAQSAGPAWSLHLKSPADIVLVDFDMPGPSGLELIKKIRREPTSPGQDAPVILMTAYSDRNCILGARDAGASEILAKPISAKSLLDRIVAAIDHPRPFVCAPTYVGPDRRRRADTLYDGPLRRREDSDVYQVAGQPSQAIGRR